MFQIQITGKVTATSEKVMKVDDREYHVITIVGSQWLGAGKQEMLFYVYIPSFLWKSQANIAKNGSRVGVTANKAEWGKIFKWQKDETIAILYATDLWI